jgi:hypothetical protein
MLRPCFAATQHRAIGIALAAALLIALPASVRHAAPAGPPPPPQPGKVLDSAEHTEIVHALAKLLPDNYVFPQVAEKTAVDLEGQGRQQQIQVGYHACSARRQPHRGPPGTHLVRSSSFPPSGFQQEVFINLQFHLPAVEVGGPPIVLPTVRWVIWEHRDRFPL